MIRRSLVKLANPQLLALVGVLLINWLLFPNFFRVTWQDGRFFGSLIDVLNRGAPVAILAVGMVGVIATKGVDLSVGAVMAVAGAVAATMVVAGYPAPIAVVAALTVGLLCGLWNGILVAILDIQPIIATLVLMILVTLVVRRTAIGLVIEAVGVNRAAASLAGIRSRMLLLVVYGLSGLCAAIAGIIVAGDIRGADADNAGLWLELDAILAVVIGGTSLLGGRFSVPLAVIGALIIQAMNTGILVSGFPPEFNLIVKAGLIFIVLVIQSPLASRLAPPRLKPAAKVSAK